MASGQSEGQRQTAHPENRRAYWSRVWRPLYWWLLLVLVLYGIRLHQRLSAQTNIEFKAVVRGEAANLGGSAWLDDQPFISGQRVRLGRHHLVIRVPNGYPFTTNLFVWYGNHDLGQIILERTKGTLIVRATPPAERLTIRGPEFATTLTNCSKFNSSVPTDRYTIEATYKYWSDSKTVSVPTDGTASQNFAPQFGAISVTASHPDIAYVLRNAKSALVESGYLPVTITNLPAGSGYQLEATRKGDPQHMQFTVCEGATNNLDVKYLYGAVEIQSDPAGAMVLSDDGRNLGITPLSLPEVKPGQFEFSLHLNDYEAVGATLEVSANETNQFSTNLVNLHYLSEISAARQFYAGKFYDRAVSAATEALKYRPGDTVATNLVHDASVLALLARAEFEAEGSNFTNAIAAAQAALSLDPDNERAKSMLADYNRREAQRLEAIRKHEAELAEQARLQRERERVAQVAQERMQELRDTFFRANAAYQNAGRFTDHELFGSNSVKTVANNLKSEMDESSIVFKNFQITWVNDHLFNLMAQERVGIGRREFLIYASQIRPDEVHVRYKVYEYDQPQPTSLLGGLVQIQTTVNTTSQDPQAIAQHQRDFQQRIQSGINLATGLVQRAIALK